MASQFQIERGPDLGAVAMERSNSLWLTCTDLAYTALQVVASLFHWIRWLPNALAFVILVYITPWLGMKVSNLEWVCLLIGAVVITLQPVWQVEIWLVTGFCIWMIKNGAFGLYLLGSASLVWWVRKKRLVVVSVMVGVTLFWPKFIYSIQKYSPAWYDWLDELGLALLLLGGVYYWRERLDGKIKDFSLKEWLGYFFFPLNPINPIRFAPSDFAHRRALGIKPSSIWRAVGLAAMKGAILFFGMKFWGDGCYWKWEAGNFSEKIRQKSFVEIWQMIGVSYVFWVLFLSGTADVVVAIARISGLNLPNNYRWVFLAWNPVELWRRWAIFNRRLLLRTIYFPLGGRERWQYRNILVTFLASAVVLHSGWFGSKYWIVGQGMLIFYSVYFLGQGLLVCACVAWWKRVGKDPSEDRELRWSWARVTCTLLTQSFTAWWHIWILCPYGVSWKERTQFLLRSIGLNLF